MTAVQLAAAIAEQNQGGRLICPAPWNLPRAVQGSRERVKYDRDELLFEGRRMARMSRRAMRAHKRLRIGR